MNAAAQLTSSPVDTSAAAAASYDDTISTSLATAYNYFLDVTTNLRNREETTVAAERNWRSAQRDARLAAAAVQDSRPDTQIHTRIASSYSGIDFKDASDFKDATRNKTSLTYPEALNQADAKEAQAKLAHRSYRQAQERENEVRQQQKASSDKVAGMLGHLAHHTHPEIEQRLSVIEQSSDTAALRTMLTGKYYTDLVHNFREHTERVLQNIQTRLKEQVSQIHSILDGTTQHVTKQQAATHAAIANIHDRLSALETHTHDTYKALGTIQAESVATAISQAQADQSGIVAHLKDQSRKLGEENTALRERLRTLSDAHKFGMSHAASVATNSLRDISSANVKNVEATVGASMPLIRTAAYASMQQQKHTNGAINDTPTMLSRGPLREPVHSLYASAERVGHAVKKAEDSIAAGTVAHIQDLGSQVAAAYATVQAIATAPDVPMWSFQHVPDINDISMSRAAAYDDGTDSEKNDEHDTECQISVNGTPLSDVIAAIESMAGEVTLMLHDAPELAGYA